jgi:hypothetical protein
MYDPARRDQLWKEYYRAMHRGDKKGAQQILNVLHSPPSNQGRADARGRGGGCSRCKKRF